MRYSPDENYLSNYIQQYLKPHAAGHGQLSEPIKSFLLSQWELEDHDPCLICARLQFLSSLPAKCPYCCLHLQTQRPY